MGRIMDTPAYQTDRLIERTATESIGLTPSSAAEILRAQNFGSGGHFIFYIAIFA